MRTTDHTFTEEPKPPFTIRLDRFEREWEAGAEEREANRALANWHFDQARDRALNAMWKDQ